MVNNEPTAFELRADLDRTNEMIAALAAQLVDALDAGDTMWAAGLACALKPALARRKSLRPRLVLAEEV